MSDQSDTLENTMSDRIGKEPVNHDGTFVETVQVPTTPPWLNPILGTRL